MATEPQLKTLYNLLRINCDQGSRIEGIEPWMVADYRLMDLEKLFADLKGLGLPLEGLGLPLDRAAFLTYAEAEESPEGLTEILAGDIEDVHIHDHSYLILFELWRRLVPEKQSLSIFCDELDALILLYDKGELQNSEPLQNALADLEGILEENNQGEVDSPQLFESIANGCANHLESFLYDFIADQLDAGNESYGSDLLDDFYEYMNESKWFNFLRARLIAQTDVKAANGIIRRLVAESKESPDLEFYLEILNFLSQTGDKDLFVSFGKETIDLLESEEDFQELLTICYEYYQCLDCDRQSEAIQKLLEKRLNIAMEEEIASQDPDVQALLKIIQEPHRSN